jgi:hypothetical protein
VFVDVEEAEDDGEETVDGVVVYGVEIIVGDVEKFVDDFETFALVGVETFVVDELTFVDCVKPSDDLTVDYLETLVDCVQS